MAPGEAGDGLSGLYWPRLLAIVDSFSANFKMELFFGLQQVIDNEHWLDNTNTPSNRSFFVVHLNVNKCIISSPEIKIQQSQIVSHTLLDVVYWNIIYSIRFCMFVFKLTTERSGLWITKHVYISWVFLYSLGISIIIFSTIHNHLPWDNFSRKRRYRNQNSMVM